MDMGVKKDYNLNDKGRKKMILDRDGCRKLRETTLSADFVIVGGGLAGVCAAITAARQGVSVVLVQDRPVLGGNASSEVRLWALGATSHMGNNNRWSREGGVIDEIMIENIYRNPEGNPLFFDALLLDKIRAEGHISLLLNTAVFSAEKETAQKISSVRAFNSQNSTLYVISAPLFCDASGDGILGYLAGAAYRIGAETAGEFNEPFAPDESYGTCLGHTIFFYTKETGHPVRYTPPDFALKDIGQIPRHTKISVRSHGCSLWWLEYGGRMDTIHQTEEIKWELWKVAYGVWNYLKNSGKFPETANQTLEWIGTIPGKRESRRFEGDYMLNQSDIVEQKRFEDAVSFGGWAVDLHPADGVYSDQAACTQYHGKGVYQIPFRALYSRTLDNLLIAGRLISASHVAFGSTRVMMTAAHNAQAVGMAAALCREGHLSPRELVEPSRMALLQRRLQRSGQYIPHLPCHDRDDLARQADMEVSSELVLGEIAPSEQSETLDCARALLLPVVGGPLPAVTFFVDAAEAGTMLFQLRSSSRPGNFTPDCIREVKMIIVNPGENQAVTVQFSVELEQPQYVFICIMPCAGVALRLSEARVTGVMALVHSANPAVAVSAVQSPPAGCGFDTFEFWLPERRPAGKLLAAEFSPPLRPFGKEQLRSGYLRPFIQSNAWVAAREDPAPELTLKWERPQVIREMVLFFDADYDHAMESVQYGHPEREMPFCVKHFQVADAAGTVLFEERDNHQGRVSVRFSEAVRTSTLTLKIRETHGAPAALFAVCVY